MAIVRQFGWAADAAAGGLAFDALTAHATYAGEPPDGVEWWPVTGGTLDKGANRINRDNEARGRRASVGPLPFRAEPVMTIPVAAYHSLVKKVLKNTLGREGTIAGTAPGPYTHPLRAVSYADGVNYLPTVFTQLARDDLNQKMSGASIQRCTLDFPFDGEGTMEVEFWGLYQRHFATAVPATSFTGLSENPLAVRDAKVYVDGSASPIDDLQAVRFAWVNNLFRKPYAGQNVRSISIGSPARTRKTWWPKLNKIGPAQDVTFGLVFGSTNPGQELAQEYLQIEKFVFELAGDPIPGTAGVDLLRITIFGGALTDGGAGPLTARDDLTSDFTGTAYYSEADSNDVLVEVVDGSATAIVVPPPV